MRRSSRLKANEEEHHSLETSFKSKKRVRVRPSVPSSDEEGEGAGPDLISITPKSNNFTKVYSSYNSERGGPVFDAYEGDFINDAVHGYQAPSSSSPSPCGCQTPTSSTEDESGSDIVPNRRTPKRTPTIKSDNEENKSSPPKPGHTPLKVARGDSDGEGGVVMRSGLRRRQRSNPAALQSSTSSEGEGLATPTRRRGKQRKLMRPESDEDSCSPGTAAIQRQPSSRLQQLRQRKARKSKHLLSELQTSRAQSKGSERSTKTVTISSPDEDDSDDCPRRMSLAPPATGPADSFFPSASQLLFPDSSSSEEDDWIVNDEEFEAELNPAESLEELDSPDPLSSQLHQAIRCEETGPGNTASRPSLGELLPALCAELEHRDSQAFTPLMLAAQRGDREALSLLLEHGADINCRGEGGTTPLHLAALSGWVGCVKELISRGHCVDCRDSTGWPPLLYAHFQKHDDCVLALMKAKPQQLSVLSDLLRKADRSESRKKDVAVIRSLLVSLAHHEAYYSVFNGFISANLSVLEEDGFRFMRHCMALLSFENKQAWLAVKKAQLRAFAVGVERCCDAPSLPSLPRSSLLPSTLARLSKLSPEQCWGHPLSVSFLDEAGICSGPRREFWSCFSRCLSNGELNLFSSCDGGQLSLQPCAVFAKHCVPPLPPPRSPEEHKARVRLVGMLMAQALFHGDTLDLCLSTPLIKQLLGQACCLADLEGLDQALHHGLTSWLQEEDSSALEDLTFTCTLVCPWSGETADVPLRANGRATRVTEDNKVEYVECFAEFRLQGSVQAELEAFREGFWKVLPPKCLQVFTPDEFSLLLSGVPSIDVEDWYCNTQYTSGVAPTDDIVLWFWRLLRSLKQEEKALLLKFATASPRVPSGGFACLQGLGGLSKFTISLMPGVNKIPKASTCFNLLRLSSYSCEQQLRDKTLIALRYGCEGFEFA